MGKTFPRTLWYLLPVLIAIQVPLLVRNLTWSQFVLAVLGVVVPMVVGWLVYWLKVRKAGSTTDSRGD